MKKIFTLAACCLFAAAAHAQLNYTVQTACHPDDVKGYDTERLRSAFLMEKVVAGVGDQAALHIGHTRLLHLLIQLFHALAAIAHRVITAGEEQNGHLLVPTLQSIPAAGALHSPQHLMEEPRRDIRTAQGILQIGRQLLSVTAEPVGRSLIGCKLFVIGSKRQLPHQIGAAVMSCLLHLTFYNSHHQSQHRRTLIARSHNDRAGKALRAAAQVLP